MKLYSISSPSRARVYFAGQTEAKKAAREWAARDNEPFDVHEHALAPGKAGIVALANGAKWCEAEEIIATMKPRKSSKKTVDADSNPWD